MPVVDLAGLEFIDCSGITVLARGRKLAQHAGGELRLAAPRFRVLRVLTLTRLTDVIPSMPALRTMPLGIWAEQPAKNGSRYARSAVCSQVQAEG